MSSSCSFPTLVSVNRKANNPISGASILLHKGGKEVESDRFNYDKLYNDFEHVLDVRRIEAPEMGLFAFLFTETSVGNEQELDKALVSDFSEYLS